MLKVVWKSWGAPSHQLLLSVIPSLNLPPHFPLSWGGELRAGGLSPPSPLTLSPGCSLLYIVVFIIVLSIDLFSCKAASLFAINLLTYLLSTLYLHLVISFRQYSRALLGKQSKFVVLFPVALLSSAPGCYFLLCRSSTAYKHKIFMSNKNTKTPRRHSKMYMQQAYYI